MTPFLQASWDDLAKKFEIFYATASESPMLKKAMTVLTHIFLAVVALILTVLIFGYIIYTISFIVPPYFRFMHIHGPYSFLFLLLLWFAALMKFMSLPSESQFSFRWEVSMYFLSFFVMFTVSGHLLSCHSFTRNFEAETHPQVHSIFVYLVFICTTLFLVSFIGFDVNGFAEMFINM